MDWSRIEAGLFDLSYITAGTLQECGALAIVPLFGADTGRQDVTPSQVIRTNADSSATRTKPALYLQNDSPRDTAIVPMHTGIRTAGRTTAFLCGAELLGSGQRRSVPDQSVTKFRIGIGTGGVVMPALPLSLRFEALHLRGVSGSRKLGQGFANLNTALGDVAGSFKSSNLRFTPQLHRLASRYELLTGQIGAIFYLEGRAVGIEIAPTARYFGEVWPGLISTGYGVAALIAERRAATPDPLAPFPAANLTELRAALFQSRRARQEHLLDVLSQSPPQRYEVEENCTVANLRLRTLIGMTFAGQVVDDDQSDSETGLDDDRPTMLRRLFGRAVQSGERRTDPRRVRYLSLFAR